MMKKMISGSVKKVLTKGKDSFMKYCQECGNYYPKDSFCSRCLIAEESREKSSVRSN